MPSTHISLDGEWALKWCDAGQGEAAGWPQSGVAGQDSVIAHVPGMTHLDLLAAGHIPEPLYGENARELEWMEEKDWWYSRTFSIPEIAAGERIELIFEGLDTCADIWVNGQHVGFSRNAFLPWRGEVTDKVKAGENLVVVRLDTGLRWGMAQEQFEVSLANNARDSARAHLRRSQFAFRWDWAPRLLTCGIWQPVHIEIHRGVILRDVCLRAQLMRDGAARMTALVEAENLESVQQEVTLDLKLKGAAESTYYATLAPGRNLITHTFTVQNPRLWWPHGMGEPYLYDFTCELKSNGGNDAISFPYGIREIELREEPLPGDEGQSFTLAVNGFPVFCKGGDWVPADSLVSRVTPERYQALICEACGANFNMLRIWGGGTYEADAFWQTCDKLGIMIWMDFQFACSPIPEENPEFLTLVTQEADYQVRRLRNHPSLALWCGNNENQWIFGSGISEGENKPNPRTGWRTYHEIIATACASLDPTRPYWPSSPYGGIGNNNENRGDRHAWQVTLFGQTPGGNTDYQAYLVDRGKFISEMGFLAPPLRESLEQGLPADQIHLASPVWNFHANLLESGLGAQGAPSMLQQALDKHFGLNSNELDLDRMILLTQAWQAEAYRFSLSHWRRRKFLTSGMLFWMYNDCWLATSSWTIIDYYLRRKPSWYALRRVFANEMLSFAPEPGRLSIWLVNDHLHSVEALLEYGTGRFSEGQATVMGRSHQIVPENCSRRLLDFPSAELSPDESIDLFYWARWVRQGEVVSYHYYWMRPWREVSLPDVDLHWEVTPCDGHHDVEVSSRRYAWMVVIDPRGEVDADDNYFDLLPGESRTIRVRGSAEALAKLNVTASNRMLKS